MLETVLTIIGKYPAVITTGLIGLFVQMAFTALWVIALVGVSLRLKTASDQSKIKIVFSYLKGGNGQTANPGDYVLILFLVFTFFWTTQVIKNVVHVTVKIMNININSR